MSPIGGKTGVFGGFKVNRISFFWKTENSQARAIAELVIEKERRIVHIASKGITRREVWVLLALVGASRLRQWLVVRQWD